MEGVNTSFTHPADWGVWARADYGQGRLCMAGVVVEVLVD